MKYLTLVSMLILGACTDAAWDKYSALGKRAEVKCYSGGTLIFHGLSTGRIANEENSDGYFARWDIIFIEGEWKYLDKAESVTMGVTGDCTLAYVKP